MELARAATDVTADRAFRNGLPLAEGVCVQTLELLTRTTGHSDDITMLTGRRVDPSAPLRLHFPASIEELAPLRARLSEWLAGCGAGRADNEAVRHAVAELATNSITHAYAGDGGDEHDCVVTADLDVTGELEMRVSDHGRWREPHPSCDSGYGMRMAGLVDSLLVGLRHDTNDPDVSPDPGSAPEFTT